MSVVISLRNIVDKHLSRRTLSKSAKWTEEALYHQVSLPVKLLLFHETCALSRTQNCGSQEFSRHLKLIILTNLPPKRLN